MLRMVLYINAFLYTVLSIVMFANSVSKKRINWISASIVLILLAIVNVALLLKCVETGWSMIFVMPAVLVTVILSVISLIRCIVAGKMNLERPSTVVCGIIAAVPVLLFVFAYSYEMYRINTCDFIVKYNYQNGIVQSDNTYLAIKNHKPAKVTLISNLFRRESSKKYLSHSDRISCAVKYRENGEISFDYMNDNSKQYETIFEKLEASVRMEYGASDSVWLIYLPQTEDAIVRVAGGEYLYYNNQIMSKLDAIGNIDEIVCY